MHKENLRTKYKCLTHTHVHTHTRIQTHAHTRTNARAHTHTKIFPLSDGTINIHYSALFPTNFRQYHYKYNICEYTYYTSARTHRDTKKDHATINFDGFNTF